MVGKLLAGFWLAAAGISQAVVPVMAYTVNEILKEYLPGLKFRECTRGKGVVPKIGDIICVLAATINILLGFAGGIAIIFLIYGGVQYITSGGDKIALTTAKHTITYSVLGLIIILGVFLIINTVLKAVGV